MKSSRSCALCVCLWVSACLVSLDRVVVHVCGGGNPLRPSSPLPSTVNLARDGLLEAGCRGCLCAPNAAGPKADPAGGKGSSASAPIPTRLTVGEVAGCSQEATPGPARVLRRQLCPAERRSVLVRCCGQRRTHIAELCVCRLSVPLSQRQTPTVLLFNQAGTYYCYCWRNASHLEPSLVLRCCLSSVLFMSCVVACVCVVYVLCVHVLLCSWLQ